MGEPLILVNVADGLATVRLNRPPSNPLNLEIGQELMRVVQELRDDASVRAMILTGTGRCFSAGVDIREVPSYTKEKLREMMLTINRLCLAIYSFPKPMVTAVDGHALGGGLVIPLTGDWRLVTDAPCKLGMAEVKAGLPFPACPMEVVKAELRPEVARRLVLRGHNLDPAEAAAEGLFDEMVPAGELMRRAGEKAGELAALPPSSYRVIKHQLRADTMARMQAIVEQERDPLLNAWVSKETQAAAEAILGKPQARRA